MGVRNKKTLAFAAIILNLLSLKFAFSKTIELNWQGGRSKECHELVLFFLTELKDRLDDDIVKFSELDQSGENAITFRCADQPYRRLEFTYGKETLPLNYLGKNAGFDSLDWLRFQRKILSEQFAESQTEPTLSDLAPEHNASTLSLPSNATETRTVVTLTSAAAGAFGGAYFSPNRESRLLNAAVFGGISALAGYLLSDALVGQ